MLARTITHALVGLDARRVEVEAHLQNGASAFAIVGHLPDRGLDGHRLQQAGGPIKAAPTNVFEAGSRRPSCTGPSGG